ncbi:MAG: hypothetical protein J1F64_06670 [Oscillospiraceae bacterium]|nr:hypothetical protein [Oscillospiraceae bacterium]
MKKSLKKAILTFAAVLAVSATMAVSAFAALTVTPTIDAAKTTITVEVDGATSGKEMTILILKKGVSDTEEITADKIEYINQDPAENGKVKWTIKLKDALEDGTYKIKVGGEDITADGIGMADLVVGGGGGGELKYAIGDVNGDEELDASDALKTARLAVGLDGGISKGFLTVSGEYISWLYGDVNADEELDASDALGIARKAVNMPNSDFKRTSV